MQFLYEQKTRHYWIFLIIFSFIFILTALLLVGVYILQSRSLILEQYNCIATSLIENGVHPTIIGQALASTETSPAGQNLTTQLGYSDHLPSYFFSLLSQSGLRFGAVALILSVLDIIVLLTGSFIYFGHRERLYKASLHTIDQFACGHFDTHLPHGQNGTLYQLFEAADTLAMALKSGKEAAQKSRLFLQNMVSDISHQLKTPLSALSMYAEIIQSDPSDTVAVEQFSTKSLESIDRMQQLIQMLLKIARLNAGSVQFKKETCALSKLAHYAAKDLFTRAALESKRIIFQGDPSLTLVCDREWTCEAISNLIKNALDHTSSDGLITIAWNATPIMIRFSVADNGCGILPEDIHHIFKRFYRSPSSNSHRGVGLGLPLAKAIIEDQGGSIAVESTPGKQTVFTISFLTQS